MSLQLAMTVTGTGSDGRDYTIHGYKETDERLISVAQTAEGDEAWCRSENPLEFWIPSKSVTVRCPQPS